MKRSTKLFCFLLCICSSLFTSCATNDTWKDEAYQGNAQNIVVMMMARTQDRRNMFEGRFVAELRDRGINATQSHKIITFEQLKDKELIKSKIKSTEADTVLIARLVDSKTIQAYQPGSVKAVPIGHSFWGTYYEIVSVDYGYTDDTRVAYIETNLYDVKTEKLIWLTRSQIEITEGESQLINSFIRGIIRKLSSDKIID
jgi:hypothetical protein